VALSSSAQCLDPRVLKHHSRSLHLSPKRVDEISTLDSDCRTMLGQRQSWQRQTFPLYKVGALARVKCEKTKIDVEMLEEAWIGG
jgi:hypothetical protein